MSVSPAMGTDDTFARPPSEQSRAQAPDEAAHESSARPWGGRMHAAAGFERVAWEQMQSVEVYVPTGVSGLLARCWRRAHETCVLRVLGTTMVAAGREARCTPRSTRTRDGGAAVARFDGRATPTVNARGTRAPWRQSERRLSRKHVPHRAARLVGGSRLTTHWHLRVNIW